MMTNHRYESLSRRSTLMTMAAASATAIFPLSALSQAARTYRIVVGSPPGALGDVLARLVANKLGEASGQTAITDNRPGVAGAIAADYVAKASGDGNTLLVAPDAVMVVNPFVYPKLPYDPLKDFKSVALLGKASLALIINPKLNVKSLADFVQLAKSKPKVLNFGSGGPGHPTHMLMELLCNRLGIQLTHVPYKGTSPAIQGLLGGEVDAMISGVVEAMPHIKAGTILPLAASGPAAKEIFPLLPQFKDAHEDLDVSVWFGVFAPASTPAAVVSSLNAEINKALQQADVQKRLGDYGLAPTPVLPADLDKLVQQDLKRFGPLVKALGLVAN
jgi:tripartite-type tricarboxylate transporter receptor subunit TctC